MQDRMGTLCATQKMSTLWGCNPLQESSSKTLVRFSAKQMTSLIKWVNTLPMLSLIAILTFRRSIFEANWAPRASRNQCHNKPHMLWKWFTKVTVQDACAQLASTLPPLPGPCVNPIAKCHAQLALSSSPARNPRSSFIIIFSYRRHFLLMWRHALFPFYSSSTYYWKTFDSVLSTRDNRPRSRLRGAYIPLGCF